MEFLQNNITLRPDPVFPLGTDTILLADFTRLPKRARVCDLGAGSGALGLLLCAKDSSCRVTGVEIRPEACALARENIADNGLEPRFSCIRGDLAHIKTLLPANGFSCAVANPPYFPAGHGPVSQTAGAARTERTCTLEDWCAAAAWVLDFGGTFTLVYRPERLCDLICALRGAGLEPKRLRPVRHRRAGAAALVLLEAKLGGRPGLQIMGDLILTRADGTPSAEYQKIYHLKGAL